MYYRIQDANQNPNDLLKSENWVSKVWIGQVFKRCPNCCGEGRVFVGDEDIRCELCDGAGEVDDSERRGVSCCRSLEDLEWYFSDRQANLDGVVVVAFDGTESDEDDWDAQDGAVLAFPEQIVWVKTLSEAGILCGDDDE